MSRRCVALPLSDGTVATVLVDGARLLTAEERAGLIELLDAAARKHSAEHPKPATTSAVSS